MSAPSRTMLHCENRRRGSQGFDPDVYPMTADYTMQYDEPWYWVGWRIFMTRRGCTKIHGCRHGAAGTTMTRGRSARTGDSRD